MEGRRMTLVLQPDHKQAGAKPPVIGGSAPARPGGMNAGQALNIPSRPSTGVPIGPPPRNAPPGGLRPGPAVAPRPAPAAPAVAPSAPGPAPAAPAPATPAAAPAPRPAPAPVSR
jgi:hypothetical protein